MLKMPLSQAQTELASRIQAGRDLLQDDYFQPQSTDESSGLIGRAVLRGIARAVTVASGATPPEQGKRAQLWHQENSFWLDRYLGGEVAELQRAHDLIMPANLLDWPQYLRASVEEEIGRLQSVHKNLHLWIPKDSKMSSSSSVGPTQPAPDGPIFIVHGSDTLRAERVARIVNKATARDTIILREQPSLGQTLIEKFEQHATNASYAIVVLTPDDEGGRKGQSRNPRGRQNVIFEMGYFYGILGRRQVSVLLHPDVEKPSDMDGIVYIKFDDGGAWKVELFRELEHAQIHVDMSRAF